MKYEITYRNQRTGEEYTLGGVEATDYNDALRIAKQYKGKGEEIASIAVYAASIFTDIINAVQKLGGPVK